MPVPDTVINSARMDGQLSTTAVSSFIDPNQFSNNGGSSGF